MAANGTPRRGLHVQVDKMGKKTALFAFVCVMAVTVLRAVVTGIESIAMDTLRINLEFANQIELTRFEAQTGSRVPQRRRPTRNRCQKRRPV
jgi:hypothetical protein